MLRPRQAVGAREGAMCITARKRTECAPRAEGSPLIPRARSALQKRPCIFSGVLVAYRPFTQEIQVIESGAFGALSCTNRLCGLFL